MIKMFNELIELKEKEQVIFPIETDFGYPKREELKKGEEDDK